MQNNSKTKYGGEDELINRITELETAIKNHRDQKLDDRCFLDDQELYKVLNDGNLGDNSVPPIEKILENCKIYLEKRCKPGEQWQSYQELKKECDQWHATADRLVARNNYLENLNK